MNAVAKLSGNLKITNSNMSEFKHSIYEGLLQQLNARIQSKLSRLISAVKEELRRRLTTSKTYMEIVGGGLLLGSLGIANPVECMEMVINSLCDSVEVVIQPFRLTTNNRVMGQVEIRAIKSDYAQQLGLDASSYTSKNGDEVHWLEWLLFAGTSEVVSGFSVYSNLPHEVLTKYSRTGQALMLKKMGGSYHVPTEHSGVASDNWIIKSLLGCETYILEKMESLLLGS